MLLLTVTVFADDLTTLSGKKYTGVTITRVEADGLAISHDDGLAKVSFTDLSEELRKKYGYDPAKAAKFNEALNASAMQRQTAELAAAAAKEYEKTHPLGRIVGRISRSQKDGLLVKLPIREVIDFKQYPARKDMKTGPIEQLYLVGHLELAKFVDGEYIDVDAVEDGTHTGAGGKVKQYKVMRVYPNPVLRFVK